MTSKWIIDIRQEPFLESIGSENVIGYIYDGQVTPEEYAKYVYINTLPITEIDTSEDTPTAFYSNMYGNILNLSVYDKCTAPFSIRIDVWLLMEDAGTVVRKLAGTVERQYIPNIVKGYDYDMKRSNKMVNSNVSYQLLRTNPKLTGNIKVVVTENSKLYLDTFKVSFALGQYKYRHVPMNANEYYGEALMHFRKMSTDDFYKVEDNCFNLFTAINDYKMQYYTVYNSGVRTNEDHLYSENFALLAPLCVKEVLPDFFLVFKVNTDSISKNKSMSEADKIKYFLSNGKLVKSFDFRDGTNLGKCVRGIRDNARNYPGDIFASYDIKNYNKFIGISVDRGVVTSAYESMYKEKPVNNQVALNDYFTLGFERNKLVSKDIINFEFMFNDTEEDLFSINTYFGIYVTLNGESDTFSCIGYDGQYVFDNDNLHNMQSGSPFVRDKHPEMIYGISTPDSFIRLRDSIYDASIMENYKLRPYRNIASGEYRYLGEETEYEYVTLKLNKDIKVGEHFRIIDLKNAVIYDVVSTNYDKYLENGLSEVCYNYVWYRRMRFTIKTVSACFTGSLENQARILASAFNKFKIGKTAVKQVRNALSVKTYNSDCLFEKVSSVSDYTQKNENLLMSYTDEDDSIVFFDVIRPKKLIVESSDVFSPDNDYFYLYPYYTDATGLRIAYVCDFQKVPTGFLNHGIVTDSISNLDSITSVFIKKDDTAELYKGFEITLYDYDGNIYETPSTVNYLLSPDLESYIVNVDNPKIYNGNLSFYSVYPINSGLCSILPLKDFYFDVLDKDTLINYFATDVSKKNVMSNGGEFLFDHMKNDTPVLSSTEEYVTDYFDKTRNSDGPLYKIDETGNIVYNKLTTDKDKDAYYSYLLRINHMNSDISLTSPYVCKWRSVGSDARGESMRIMYSYDSSNMPVGHSYYVPYDENDAVYNDKVKSSKMGESCYDSDLGYIETGETNSQFIKYLNTFYGNSLLSGNVNEEGMSVRDGILSGRISIDDMLYYNSIGKNKFSTVYKAGENTIEFISGGIKTKIRSSNSDIINFNTYSGYQAVLVSVPGFNSEHNTNTELIIDEVNRQMAIIIYTGMTSAESDQVKKSSVFKVLHNSPLYESRCTVIDGRKCLQIPNDTNLDVALCDTTGYVVLMNKSEFKNTGYSSVKDVMIVSRINPDTEFTYQDASYITVLDPYIIVGGDIQEATNSLISLYTDFYHDGIDMYVVSDSAEYDINTPMQKSDLQPALESCGIYVRKHEGVKDYTNLEKFLSFTVVPPYKVRKEERVKQMKDIVTIENGIKKTYGYVQTTYGAPLMRDLLEFNYSNQDTNAAFNRILDGMNAEVTNLKPISQLWINKCTTSPNYCIPIDSSYPRVSVDCLTNVSIIDNCWSDMYYDYNIHDFLGNDDYDNIEWSTPVQGYQTGYEKVCFLGSRGINMNGKEGNSIDLTVWKNTKISEKEKYIKLDISESLIYKILFTKGFSNSWRYLGLRSNTYKIKYIKNTILPLLNITSKTVFTLYKFENTKKLMFKDLTLSEDIVEVSNVKNELKYENGKYYMYVYPDEMHTYYAKMHIEL